MENEIMINKHCFELFKSIITKRANQYREKGDDFRFAYTSVECMLDYLESGDYSMLAQFDY